MDVAQLACTTMVTGPGCVSQGTWKAACWTPPLFDTQKIGALTPATWIFSDPLFGSGNVVGNGPRPKLLPWSTP